MVKKNKNKAKSFFSTKIKVNEQTGLTVSASYNSATNSVEFLDTNGTKLPIGDVSMK